MTFGRRRGADDAVTGAAREKRRVAVSSVAAAAMLACVKLAAGLATGSLGLLAEAVHSGLDLVAAVITCVAVRASDAPADEGHHYGHGKVESLSALAETGLLLLTCGWIAYEATARLFFRHVPVDATVWAFLVVLVSIAVDVSRSRALARVAKKHGSQALEADALHFSSDVWSSAVVLLGLALVGAGSATGWRALARADAAASIVVAAIVAAACWRLGRRAVDALLDRAPAGGAAGVRQAAEKVAGVLGCRRVRLRCAGNRTFVDMVVGVRRCATAESSHAIGRAAADRVAALLPGADVVVHVDPQRTSDETPAERVRAIAANMGQSVHAVTVTEGSDGLHVELHAETSEGQSLREAHRRASELEAAVAAEMPDVVGMTVSIEPESAQAQARCAGGTEAEAVMSAVAASARCDDRIVGCHDIAAQRIGGGLCLTMHCVFPAEMSVGRVHSAVSALGERLRAAVPGLARVTIHPEPDSDPRV